jgi:hypothetical protein
MTLRANRFRARKPAAKRQPRAPAPRTVPGSLLAWRPLAWVEAVLIVSLSAWLSIHLWAGGLQARWGLIDDREVLDWLGPGHRIQVTGILPIILGSEIRLFGHYTRFRPAYYTLRAIELWTWGDSPGSWYACRIVLFGISLAICMWLLVRLAGPGPGILFPVYLSTGVYWAAIFGKLGPGETYAVFGTAMYCLGLHFCLRYARRPGPGPWAALAWAAATVGAWIAIGSKENFVLLALPPAGIVWWQYRRRNLTRAALAGALLIAAGAGAVALGVGLAVMRSGHDIYMQSVSTGSRAAVLLSALKASSRPLWIAGAISAAVVLAWGPWRFRPDFSAALRRYAVRLVAFEWMLGAAYGAQIVFYNGGWAPDSRYAFPGATIAAFIWFLPAALWLDDRVLAPAGSLRRLLIAVSVCAVLALGVWRAGFEASRTAVSQNARQTQLLDWGVRRIAAAVKQNPRAPIALWSTTIRDYEAYFAIRSLLRNQDAPNPVTIRTPEDARYDLNGFAPELADNLLRDIRKLQAEGNAAIAPNSILKSGNCYAVGVWTDPPRGDACRSLGSIF